MKIVTYVSKIRNLPASIFNNFSKAFKDYCPDFLGRTLKW